jgi:hypothetical protein
MAKVKVEMTKPTKPIGVLAAQISANRRAFFTDASIAVYSRIRKSLVRISNMWNLGREVKLLEQLRRDCHARLDRRELQIMLCGDLFAVFERWRMCRMAVRW